MISMYCTSGDLVSNLKLSPSSGTDLSKKNIPHFCHYNFDPQHLDETYLHSAGAEGVVSVS